MRSLLLLVLFFAAAVSLGQNGAKAVAAKALQAEALPCDTDAAKWKGCHAGAPLLQTGLRWFRIFQEAQRLLYVGILRVEFLGL
jgi:hypothetical protein